LDRNLPVDTSAIWLLQDDGSLCLSAVHGIDGAQLESTCIANPETTYAMIDALESDVPVIRRPEDPIGPTGLTAGLTQITLRLLRHCGWVTVRWGC
jgi:hypothetical protein